MTEQQIKNYINDWINDKLEKPHTFTSSNVSIPKAPSIEDYVTHYRFDMQYAQCLEFTVEVKDKSTSIEKTEKTNVYLLNNIEYEDNRIFMDGEQQVLRLFILETNNKLRFFTAEGNYDNTLGFSKHKHGYNSFCGYGTPVERDEESFLYLLQNHKSLKNSAFTKYTNAIISHSALQDKVGSKSKITSSFKL